jgi:hypothetical protein
MSTFNVREFIRPETLRTIAPRSLLALLRPHRKFFEGVGLKLPAAQNAGTLDLQRLAAILGTPHVGLPVRLADALYHINELATVEGMDALLEEFDPDELGVNMFSAEPADVAVGAWLKDPTAVERKHAEILASRPRRFQYFQSYDDPPPPLPEITSDRMQVLEAYLDKGFTARGRGPGVRVQPWRRESGFLFMIRHADPRRREGALEGTEETSVLYRPLKFDVVGYDAVTGTLRVSAKTDWERSLYRNGFGLALFDALDHFPRTGRYTLQPLRSGDRECLACADAPPIKHVNLVELRLHWGGVYDGEDHISATDVFAWLRQCQRDIPSAARITTAAFDVFVFGEKKPRRVTVIPPNVARYSHEDQSQLIDHWLALRGFINTSVSTSDEHEAPDLLRVP